MPIRGAKRLSAGRYGGFQFWRVSRGRRQKRCGRSIKPPPRFLREIAGKESKPIQRNGQLGIGFARRTSFVRPLEGTVAFMDRDRGAVNRENEKGGSAPNPILPSRPWYGFPQWRWGRNHIDTHGWRWFGPRASSERRSVGFRLAHLVQRWC